MTCVWFSRLVYSVLCATP